MAAPQVGNAFGDATSGTPLGNLNGLFKKIYGDKLDNLIPEFTQIQVDIPFKRSKKIGLEFEQPVIIGLEQGFTYARSGAGAFTLNNPAAGKILPAKIRGSQHVLRSQVDYESLFSGEGSPEAFENTMGVVVRNMLESIRRRIEIDFLYGQDVNGIGTIASGGTTTTWVITTSQWAPGIWAGMEGAALETFAAANPLVTKRVGTAYVTSVDLDAKSITVDAAPAASANTDVITFAGQRLGSGDTPTNTWNVMVGLHAILTNTGTLFNIDAATYNLWKGNTQTSGSLDLSMDALLKGDAKRVAKGGSGPLNVYVNPLAWANLMSDQAALRRFDKEDSGSTYEVGAEKILFHSQAGPLAIKSHPCVKEGFAYAIAPRLFKRVGATDVTFDNSRMVGVSAGADQFFRPLADSAGVEVRCYSHQAIFTDMPGKNFLVNNIVNS